MMHCTVEELLALRANEGSAWARQHLDGCAVCRAELDGLYQRVAQLKALPAIGPARSRWPAIRAQVVAAQARRRHRWVGSGLAAAALLAGVMVFQPFRASRAFGVELAQAKQQSASLETELQQYDPDSRVESGRAAAMAADLEDRIAAVDARLSGPAPSDTREVVQLWRNRVNLMQRLVDVHVTRAGYEGL
jgi:hypothetical protein